MNRCYLPFSFPSSRRALWRWLAGAAALALLATSAQAGLRMFPANAKRGQITFTNPPQVQLNELAEQIGPGTRIHDANNRLVFANTLKGQTFTVNYVRGVNRTLRDIWILTLAEAQEKPPSDPETTGLQLRQAPAGN
jgi:hypothetical protein